MTRIDRFIGGAGTGKTTLILSQLDQAKKELGLSTDQIGFCTFTRAGRSELSTRAGDMWGVSVDDLTRRGWFKTAHAIAYQCCGIKKGQLLSGKDGDQWTSDVLGCKVVVATDARGERRYVSDEDETIPRIMQAWDLARNTMKPLSWVLERWLHSGERTPDLSEARAVIRKYEKAKFQQDKLDFTDMIAGFAGVKFTIDGPEATNPLGEPPEGLRVLAIDEAQDSSPLVDRVCRRLAASDTIERVLLTGDPYQCQPAGTPVLTSTGYKCIEDLDPSADKIIAYSKSLGCFTGTGKKIVFQKASREIDSGELVEISFSDGTKSICTDTHKWLVRTSRGNVFATYLMRRGDRWRIGTVQMFANSSDKSRDKNGDFRLKMRMNQEGADAVWVLKTFGTDREARQYEQVASFKFGIPQITFRPPWSGKKKCNLDQQFIDEVFSQLGCLSEKAVKCLSAHGLHEMYPFCSKACRSKNGELASRFMQACNLIPGIHKVPKLTDLLGRSLSGCDWVVVESVRRLDAGKAVTVYSLNVEEHHTYVTTNGIVTGNSIYGFSGGDYRLFLQWEANESIMPRSYRCPSRIMDLGERCLRKMRSGYRDRKIQPAKDGGTIRSAVGVVDGLAGVTPESSVLILGRCAFNLNDFERELIRKRIPYQWVDKGHSVSMCAGFESLMAIEKGEPFLGEDFAHAVDMIVQKENLVRGVKSAWKNGQKSNMDIIEPVDSHLLAAGLTPKAIELIRKGRFPELIEERTAERAEVWRETAIKCGVEVASNPPVRLSTIHGAKGLEADAVILSSDTSNAVERGRRSLDDIHDEECRVAYVAVTRAKERFTFVHGHEQNGMELPI